MSGGVNVVAHNLQGMFSNRQLGIVTNKKEKSIEKLASGYKINRAADNAAGLAISEKMRRQIRGLTQGTQNTQDGISMCQIADGALAEVSEIMHRLTELSVQSANDTNNASDRHAIQQEVNQLIKEIDRVSNSTTFNEQNIFGLGLQAENGSSAVSSTTQLTNDEIIQKIMDGSFPAITDDIELEDVGGTLKAAKANEIIDGLGKDFMYLDEMLGNKYTFPADKAKIESIFWKTHDDAYNYEKSEHEKNSVIDWEDTYVYQQWQQADARAKIGFETNGRNYFFNSSTHMTYYGTNSGTFGSIVTYLGTGDAGNMMSSATVLASSAYAYAFGDDVSYVVGLQERDGEFYDLCYQMNITGSADNYDSKKDIVCDIYRYIYSRQEASGQSITADNQHEGVWIQSGSEKDDGLYIKFELINTNILGIKDLDVSTRGGAQDAITRVKKGLEKISSTRSDIGAQQNRLEHTIRHQECTIENTLTAESRIRDTDMAKEMVAFSASDIIQQAGQAMLTQSNQSNQGVLSLLQ